MKKQLFISVFFLISLSLFASTQNEGPIEAPHVAFVKGKAFIYDSEANEREAEKGSLITEGEVIRTTKGSLLVVHIRDRVKMKINPNTVVEVESLLKENPVTNLLSKSSDNIFIHAGNIFIEYLKKMNNSELKVRTKHTSLGVRGTKFFVNVDIEDERQYTMAVSEGEVAVSSHQSQKDLSVTAGNATLLDPNGELAPTKSYDWVEQLNWNFDPQKGSLFTAEKVFQKMKRTWLNYSKNVIKKRDSLFNSQKKKFDSLYSR